jgi:transglycosylase-like protein with SLT domain
MTNTVSKTVSDETLDCIITIESAGNPYAKAPTSSATGLFQFLNKTWLGTVAKHRPDIYENTQQAKLLAMRTDPVFCIEMGARFTEDNQRAIGMDCTGGDLYLAHFLGVGDARDFYHANPDTPADKLVSPQVIAANRSIFIVNGRMQTAGEIRAWAARKMAKAGGRGWIKKYWKTADVVPMPKPRQEPEETAEDIPDPQDAPATSAPTVVVPADAPPVVVEKRAEESAARDAETSPSWLKRQWKKVTGAAGGFVASIGGFAFDWRLMAVIMISIAIGVGFIIWFMGPGNVREWVRRQVS